MARSAPRGTDTRPGPPVGRPGWLAWRSAPRPSSAPRRRPPSPGYVVQRLALPPDQLRPAGHRHPRLPEDHGRRRWAGSPSSASRCSRPGRTGTPATSRRPTTCRRTRPLYYYSFTDAFIAMAYRSLTPAEQARFDPMITGFNPADMYAADHIKRVLPDLPRRLLRDRRVHDPQGVRLVEDRGRDGQPHQPGARPRSSTSRARSGSSCILHNDVDMPFPKPGQEPYQAAQLGALFRRHPKTTIIWAHCGLGRIVHPVKDQLGIVDRALDDPALAHVSIDISWDEVAKYLVATPGDDRRRRPTSSTATPTASCSAPTRWRRPSRRST